MFLFIAFESMQYAVCFLSLALASHVFGCQLNLVRDGASPNELLPSMPHRMHLWDAKTRSFAANLQEIELFHEFSFIFSIPVSYDTSKT